MPQWTELRHQIDDLALQVVVGDPTSDTVTSGWVPALERIRQSAEQYRANEVADAARDLMQSLQNAKEVEGAGLGVDAAKLLEGVALLQQAAEAGPQTAAEDLSPAKDPELLGDFLMESREHLTAIEQQTLNIERDPLNSEALNSVFRGFHTIKGLAGFLELWEIQQLAHDVEAILDRARNGQLLITPAAIDVILQGADYLRRWLSHLEAQSQNRPSSAPAPDEALMTRIQDLSGSPETDPPACGLAALAGAVTAGSGEPESPPPVERTTVEVLSEPPNTPVARVAPRSEPAPGKAGSEDAAAGSSPSVRNESRAVKVDTTKLDYLVDMAGEMVIAESLVRHDPEMSGLKSPALQSKLAQLTRITSELQKTAMAMRLVPIGPLFHRMARLVRDLSRQFGKRVEMETAGDEIELDRTIAEELSDPLMHMVRNAVDHGIEAPAEREACGKDATARLLLKAQHQAGQVVVEISDDGRGLDRDKILAKALERGLITSVADLSDLEIHNLIFLPGFSTAARVTNVSGRGVGMDVVRRHVERLRGRIEVRSNPGHGSTFLLKLPLTLAIIDGLVVGVGQERYIVPLFTVREMFRPGPEALWTVQGRREMALVRGSLLPVHRLYRRFRVTPRSEDPLQSILVVAEVEGQRFCLVVDELIGKQEVVIKSLGETFQHVTGIAGGAILGDGRVGLILDVERLFKEQSRESSQ